MPLLCEIYFGICLTTEEKARKTLSQVKKNLSQSTVYILPKYPHITKPSQTHTLQNPHKHTHYKTYTYTHTHTHEHTHVTKQYKTTIVQIKTKYNTEAKHSSSDPVTNIIAGVIPKSLLQSRKRLNLHPNTYTYTYIYIYIYIYIQMQKSVILGTYSIVRNFLNYK